MDSTHITFITPFAYEEILTKMLTETSRRLQDGAFVNSNKGNANKDDGTVHFTLDLLATCSLSETFLFACSDVQQLLEALVSEYQRILKCEFVLPHLRSKQNEFVSVTLECGHSEFLNLKTIAESCNVKIHPAQESRATSLDKLPLVHSIPLVKTTKESALKLSSYLNHMCKLESRKLLANAVQEGIVACRIPLEAVFYNNRGELKKILALGENWMDASLYLLLGSEYALDYLLCAWPFDDNNLDKLQLYASLITSKHGRLAFPQSAVKAAREHEAYLECLMQLWGEEHYDILFQTIFASNLKVLKCYHRHFKGTNEEFVKLVFSRSAIEKSSEELHYMLCYLFELPNNGFSSSRPSADEITTFLKSIDSYSYGTQLEQLLDVFIRCNYINWTDEQYGYYLQREKYLRAGDKSLLKCMRNHRIRTQFQNNVFLPQERKKQRTDR